MPSSTAASDASAAAHPTAVASNSDDNRRAIEALTNVLTVFETQRDEDNATDPKPTLAGCVEGHEKSI